MLMLQIFWGNVIMLKYFDKKMMFFQHDNFAFKNLLFNLQSNNLFLNIMCDVIWLFLKCFVMMIVVLLHKLILRH
jgi:hypothetical protein